MESNFELNKDVAGEYRFKLIAANGMTIAISQGYNTRESALKVIESVKLFAAGAAIEDRTRYADLIAAAVNMGQDTLEVYRRWGWL